MWMTWSQILAAQVLTPGFDCAGPEKDRQCLSDFFNKVSTSVITPPCNGLEAVNDCSVSTSNAGLESSTNVGRETSTNVGRETSTDVGRETSTDAKASAITSKAGWISVLAVVLTVMAS
ncbi:hypothetical protein LSAT2_012160 [Lamellibrachia satsuma]|nr:hypothetical protein LSAT2_012160 [Lamellibrachia satsuma]